MTTDSVDSRVRLRLADADDLPWIFRMQSDPESNRLAVTNPRTAEAFDAHWAAVLVDPNITARVILLGDATVGLISVFQRDARDYVGYWIEREHWGRGIASEALRLLLVEVTRRPLAARVATSNPASLRILTKCGFEVVSVHAAPATDRFPACEEALLERRW
jgi:RimJ/RimL family protein N-acetyltransferase